MPGYLDNTSGITFGWADGEDGWGGATNRSLRQIAYGGVHKMILDRGTNRPPALQQGQERELGESYLVGRLPSGEWSSFSPNDIAVYGRKEGEPETLEWLSYTPKVGWVVYNAQAESLFVFDGTSWTAVGSGGRSSLIRIRHDNSLTGTGVSDDLSVNWDQQIQSDWTVTSSTSPAFIKNLPPALRRYQTPVAVKPFWQKVVKLTGYSLQSGRLSRSDRLAQIRLNSQVADTYDLKLGAGIVIEPSGGENSTTRIQLQVTEPDTTLNIAASESMALTDTRVFVGSQGKYEFDVHAVVTASSADVFDVMYTVHGGLAVG